MLDAKAELGEGPVWHPAQQRLYWVDITRAELHSFDPIARQDAVYSVHHQVGCAVIRASGGFILGLHNGFAAFDPITGSLTMLADPESRTTGNRFNDGKCDPAGRLFAGTLGKPGTASLYRLDANLHVEPMLRNITCSNGLAWSTNHKTCYYIDTPTSQIAAFDYDIDTGAIANRHIAVEIPAADGLPDGMAIDSEDMLWVGRWGGGHVIRWDPKTGRKLARIWVPASQSTSCAFGGQNLDLLYITSARSGLTTHQLESQPHAGGLFVAEPGVSGAPVHGFAG